MKLSRLSRCIPKKTAYLGLFWQEACRKVCQDCLKSAVWGQYGDGTATSPSLSDLPGHQRRHDTSHPASSNLGATAAGTGRLCSRWPPNARCQESSLPGDLSKRPVPNRNGMERVEIPGENHANQGPTIYSIPKKKTRVHLYLGILLRCVSSYFCSWVSL